MYNRSSYGAFSCYFFDNYIFIRNVVLKLLANQIQTWTFQRNFFLQALKPSARCHLYTEKQMLSCFFLKSLRCSCPFSTPPPPHWQLFASSWHFATEIFRFYYCNAWIFIWHFDEDIKTKTRLLFLSLLSVKQIRIPRYRIRGAPVTLSTNFKKNDKRSTNGLRDDAKSVATKITTHWRSWCKACRNPNVKLPLCTWFNLETFGSRVTLLVVLLVM